MSLFLVPLFLSISPAQDVTGVYEVSGAGSNPCVLLQETASGGIFGYITGSPGTWITSGHRSGSEIFIELQGQDGGDEDWFGTLRLHPDGVNLDGAYESDEEYTPVYLSKTKLDFVDEQWIWYDESNDIVANVRRTLDTDGAFMSGSFSATDGCDFMACGGSIESWTDVAATHTIHTTSSGECWQSGDLVGTWDPASNELLGTWTSMNCVSTTPSGGNFLGGKVGESNRKHIQDLLSSIATFVNDFEGESVAAADLFHTSYLSDGVTKADWQAQFSAWFAEYDSIEVTIEGPREIVTYNDSDVHPWLIDDLRMDWKISAQGLSVSTATVETFWEREEPTILGPDLRYIGSESGRYVIIGNGATSPLTIGLPLLKDDVGYNTYGAWPFGLHGGGHPGDGHGGIDFEFQLGKPVRAAADGEIIDIRLNTSHPPAVIYDVIQEIRPGISIQYGELQSLLISEGDVLTAGDEIGSPWEITHDGGTYAMIHFALSASISGDLCPVEWWNTSAQADWDEIWPQCFYSEELCEPFACNDRDAEPPYTATWDLESAGSGSGPDSILFYRADGYADDYVYTFFDGTGAVTETGVTEGSNSPSTLGFKFVADGTGVITFGAVDVVGDEMQLKLGATMPRSMRGASTYRYQE